MAETPGQPGSGGRLRFWGSLRLRLSASVVGIVLAGISLGMVLDYFREYRLQRQAVIASLEEHAQALKLARASIADDRSFARHVDEFCARMNETISPGHHILVLDRHGRLSVSTRRHSGPEVEQALLSADPGRSILSLDKHRLAQVRLADADGTTIVVAEYLDHMESILRQQMLGRALAAGAMGVAVVVLLFLAMSRWVLKPLSRLKAAARAWSQRHFSARSERTGPNDLRVLVGEFNSMAAELERHERDRIAELERAKMIQARLMPASAPSVPGLSVVAGYRPAEHVAGDLYDIFGLQDGTTAFAVLDVAGHGVSAALLTGVVKVSLRWRLGEKPDPARAACLLNRELLGCSSDGQFVTACVGIWGPGRKTWTYCAAGQSGGAVLSGLHVRHLAATGPLLGVLSEEQWSGPTLELRPGDRLFLYTDGLVEAGAPLNQLGRSGLEEILQRSSDAPLAEQLALLMAEAADRTAGRLRDDVTVVAFEVSAD